MKPFQAFGAALLGICLASPAVLADDASQSKAQAAASTWLGKIDAGDYAASWKDASAYLRGAVPEKSWVGSLEGVRTPLGKKSWRKLKSADPMKSLPGAPDGNYVVMQFDASFEKKASAVETVTFVEEKDGAWKAAGYLIK